MRVHLTDSQIARLNRAVAVGELEGPQAGLTALAEIDASLRRHTTVAAYLHAKEGNTAIAADLYVKASCAATSTVERDHLIGEVARLRSR